MKSVQSRPPQDKRGGAAKTSFSRWFNSLRSSQKIALISATTALLGVLLGGLFSGPTIATIISIRATDSKEDRLTLEARLTGPAPTGTPQASTPTPARVTPTRGATPGPSPTFLATYFYERPLFDINLLSYTEQTDTLEVTNQLISKRDIIDLPDSPYQVASASLQIEVHPNYIGDLKYGETVLRLTGETGGEEIFALWQDFSKDSATLQVKIPLSTLISLSGVKFTDASLSTNLRVGPEPVPSGKVTFEVIQVARPKDPFPGKKTLDVVNTPWNQAAKIVYRNGGWVVDYAVTNLGRDGEFGYNINIVKAYGPVGVDAHAVWSGTHPVYGNIPEPRSFSLKTGETYQETIPIDKAIPHGRYIFQIYTFKALPYIQFQSPTDVLEYDYNWLTASPETQLLFVICADPGQTCEQTASDPIELHDMVVSDFRKGDNGFIDFWTESYQADEHLAHRFNAIYSLDPQEVGWAGFSIDFPTPVDFSRYNYLRFTLKFGETPSPLWLDLCSTDADSGEESWNRVRLGDGRFGELHPDEQTVIIPLSAYNNVDFTRVAWIHILADENLVPDDQEHQFAIGHIEFTDATPK